MSNEELTLLAELQCKPKNKLTSAERAQLNALERKAKSLAREKEDQERKSNNTKGGTNNVFDIESTTNVQPIKIRLLATERALLKELASDIKTKDELLVVSELGSTKEINETKLIRAAIQLLRQSSHSEIVGAIKESRLAMFSYNKTKQP